MPTVEVYDTDKTLFGHLSGVSAAELRTSRRHVLMLDDGGVSSEFVVPEEIPADPDAMLASFRTITMRVERRNRRITKLEMREAHDRLSSIPGVPIYAERFEDNVTMSTVFRWPVLVVEDRDREDLFEHSGFELVEEPYGWTLARQEQFWWASHADRTAATSSEMHARRAGKSMAARIERDMMETLADLPTTTTISSTKPPATAEEMLEAMKAMMTEKLLRPSDRAFPGGLMGTPRLEVPKPERSSAFDYYSERSPIIDIVYKPKGMIKPGFV